MFENGHKRTSVSWLIWRSATKLSIKRSSCVTAQMVSCYTQNMIKVILKMPYLFLLLLLIGCASLPESWIEMYEGSSPPDNKVVILSYYFHSPDHQIKIDGKSYATYKKSFVHFTVWPGEHRINYIVSVSNVTGAVAWTCDVNLEAGHEYILIAESKCDKYWKLKRQYTSRVYLRDRTTEDEIECP